MLNKYLNLFILTVLITVNVTACSSWFEDEQYIATTNPPDPMLIYKEKHRIYWEIKKDPLIINDKEKQKEWFKSILDNSDPDYQQLQQKYINEVINLWNNRNY